MKRLAVLLMMAAPIVASCGSGPSCAERGGTIVQDAPIFMPIYHPGLCYGNGQCQPGWTQCMFVPQSHCEMPKGVQP